MSAPTPRDYQRAVIEAARKAFAAGAKRHLIILPTGTGKTVVASEVLRGVARREKRGIFLAHRTELIQQASAKLDAFEVPHGVIQGSRPMRLREPVQVASVATLVNRPEAFPDVDVIFVDEAHHASASSYQRILQQHPRAIVVGLTATPWRLDGAGLSDIFDSHHVGLTPWEANEKKWLCDVQCFTYRPIETSAVRVTAGDYNAAQLSIAAMEAKVLGDVVGEYKRHTPGKRGVFFACTVEHSMAQAEAFRAHGVQAEHIDAKSHRDERAAVLDRLRRGVTQVVCNVDIATEGFDLPELEVCMLGRPTLSLAKFLQFVGRVLRPAPGKPFARVNDHARLLTAFGHPYDERDFSPVHTEKVKRAVVEQREVQPGGEVKPRTLLEIKEAHAVEVRRGEALKPAPGSDMERRLSFEKRYPGEWQQRAQFLRLVQKHGELEKAKRAYAWQSGFSHRAKESWVSDASDLLRGKILTNPNPTHWSEI